MNSNEYDDDYDDQYDYDVHYFVDASNYRMDATFNDDNDNDVQPSPPSSAAAHPGKMDYDAIRTYNRTMKDIESDQEYWNHNRNMNRNTTTTPTMNSESSDRTGAKQYRGPDLMRGGRTPNPNNTPPPTNANSSSSGGAAAGRGRGGRGGNNGRGRGAMSGKSSQPPTLTNTNTSTTASTNAAVNTKPTPPPVVSNLRHKARVLDKRRDQQKKEQMKRTGGAS